MPPLLVSEGGHGGGTVDGLARRALRYPIITDPGYLRLRTGLTTVTALGLAMTTAFLVIPALVSVTVGTVLVRFGWIAELGFIVALFAAVWMRRWGPRGLASGMVVYIAYFYAVVLQATVTELPLLYAGICTGVTVTVFGRTVVFPETPEREINSLMEALRAECRSGLDVIRRRGPSESSTPSRTLDRIGTTVMMIEDWIDRNDARSCLGVENPDMSRLVFDAQVTTEEAFVAMASQWSVRDEDLTRAVDELAEVLRPSLTAEQASAMRAGAQAAADEVDTCTREVRGADYLPGGGGARDPAQRAPPDIARFALRARTPTTLGVERRPRRPVGKQPCRNPGRGGGERCDGCR